MIINLFCDASINTDAKVACGGCVATMQPDPRKRDMTVISKRMIIQKNATNNSAEILAIWIGVVEALKIRQIYPGAIFRLFSDSKISLYGLRDWMKNWIRNINEEGVLISSSGRPVMNQQRFIEIYNLIVENNLHIELYHQRGHVLDGKTAMNVARAQFIRANKVPPEELGVDIELLSYYNDMIDKCTREAVRAYLRDGTLLEYTELEGINPMVYAIRANMLHQYIHCINKTSVRSYHDFKGGYSQ